MDNFKFFALLPAALFCLVSCTYDKTDLAGPETGYPDQVAAVLTSRCAIPGCHNDESYAGAGGLNLSTWEKLFAGSRGGSVVVPFRSDYSTLCYYTNTDSLRGLVLEPTMPFGGQPLSEQDYELIRNWVDHGAPDKSGRIKFSDVLTGSCLYICNKGCDVVTILEPASGLSMRYVDVGTGPEVEGPILVRVSPDKNYWYVLFDQGSILQKFRTSDNQKVGELFIGTGIWTSMAVTSDSKYGFLSDAGYNGRILYVNLESMQVVTSYETGLHYPAGLYLNADGSILYAAAQEGNFIYKLGLTDRMNPTLTEVSLETGIPPNNTDLLNSCSILLSADESKYFIVCTKSSELRMVQASNDSLLAVYPTGSNPSEIVASEMYGYLFVSCLGVPGTVKKSVINVYDLTTGSPLAEVEAGHDSRGIIVDEGLGKLFVANRNVTQGGPSAHHGSICDGKNGYLTAVQLDGLQLDPIFKIELSVDPYQIAK